ncbi:hypothetical protein Tco_0252435 [Tanacetum coccineum]
MVVKNEVVVDLYGSGCGCLGWWTGGVIIEDGGLRFETYVKSKDLDLWHVITNDDFQPIQQNPKTKLDEIIPFEQQSDDLKKRLTKNNEAKMVIYNALPKEINMDEFSCGNKAKDNLGKFVNHPSRCGDPNHLIRECPKPPKDKNQRAFVRGSWSNSGEEDDEKVKDETCLVAHASSEVCSESSYFSDENSSIDDLALRQ